MAKATCTINGCDRPVVGRGWCSKHWGRWKRHGDPLVVKIRPRNTCSIDGCDEPVVGGALCGKHYQRWRKHGDPLAVAMVIGDDDARFWSHVTKDGAIPPKRPDLGPCWLWTGAKNHSGYGRFSVGYREIPAARYICQATYGPMSDDIYPDHLCKVTSCVNPDHLEPVPQRINKLRSDNPMAVNARKTHCIHDHEFTPENTRVTIKPDGTVRRSCRQCGRDANRRHQERMRAAKAASAAA